VLYIIIVTTECNRTCRYCGGKLQEMPTTIQYPLTDLISLIEHDANPNIAFYGGEPLLSLSTIKEIITTIPASHFILNTNGYNIQKLGPHINKIDTILLSVDGRPTTTDYYRGAGCNKQIHNALHHLNNKDYTGEIIARMTISHHSDIYHDVNYLLTYFPLVHWQLDVVRSTQWTHKEFNNWAEISYRPGIKKLINQFNTAINQNKILGIIPFLGIITRMLHGGTGLPCQAGTHSVTITTDGKILACPIAPEFTWNFLGTIKNYTTKHICTPCPDCEIYNECGGRCLFFHQEWLWGPDGFTSICNITKYLVRELKKHKSLYQHHSDLFHYPPYNNTTEIIP
jgi:putative peptide-modifying radical SAM enzyme